MAKMNGTMAAMANVPPREEDLLVVITMNRATTNQIKKKSDMRDYI